MFLLISGRIYTEKISIIRCSEFNGTQRVVRTELQPNQMTVFPLGSYHTPMNPDSTLALTIASFDSEDLVAGLIAPGLFTQTDYLVAPTFGEAFKGEDIERIKHFVPQRAVFTMKKCLAKCNIMNRKV